MRCQMTFQALCRALLCSSLLWGGATVQGCSDAETTPPGDAGPDKLITNHEASTPDVPQVKDGPAAELQVQPEASVPDQTVLDSAPALDGQSSCTSDSDCKVLDDCCECKGIYTWITPPSCPKTCIINTCSSWGLQKPAAYCVKGKCVVGEGTTGSCSATVQCKQVVDCCNCLALPYTITDPPCAITTCLVDACTAQGLTGTMASCTAGVCKLVP